MPRTLLLQWEPWNRHYAPPPPEPWGFFDYLKATAITLLIAWIISILIRPPAALKHWSHHFPGLQLSSRALYQKIIDEVKERKPEGVSFEYAMYFESGIFSPRREFLCIEFKQFKMDVCCMSFGTGYYISWWLGEAEPGLLSRVPLLNTLLGKNPLYQSYYQLDTATLFQSGIHDAILKVIDDISTEKGIRLLTEFERTPLFENAIFNRKR